MTEPWIWGLIASLILLAIGTSLKSAHDTFLLKQSDKEVARLSSEIVSLKKSHNETISGIRKSNSAEIEKLSNEIPKSPEKTHDQHLEEIKVNILRLLAKHPSITDELISREAAINVQLIKFHLTELEKMKLIHGGYSTMSATKWSLKHEGRAYLVKHGLLS